MQINYTLGKTIALTNYSVLTLENCKILKENISENQIQFDL